MRFESCKYITVKRFSIRRKDFYEIRDESDWGNFLRKFEVDKALDGFTEKYFDRALELGCGSGKHSKYLTSYCKKLFATEYDNAKLTPDLIGGQCDGKVEFSIADAQNLWQFKDEQMDLVFSSNVLEHLPNPAKSLAECRRVIKQNGYIIHTVPNRTWQIFHLLLYYPFLIKTALRRMFITNGQSTSRIVGCALHTNKERVGTAHPTYLDDNLRPIANTHSLVRALLPRVHGISGSFRSCFRNWAEDRWIKMFEKQSLEIVRIVRLPFYFGHGYNFRILLRLGNYLGLSSCTAYILRKTQDS